MVKTKYTKEKLQSSPELRLKLYESTLVDYNKGELFKNIRYDCGLIKNENLLSKGFCFYFYYSTNIKLDLYVGKFKSILPELYQNRLYASSSYYFDNNEERITALIKSIEDVKLLIKQQNELKR